MQSKMTNLTKTVLTALCDSIVIKELSSSTISRELIVAACTVCEAGTIMKYMQGMEVTCMASDKGNPEQHAWEGGQGGRGEGGNIMGVTCMASRILRRYS